MLKKDTTPELCLQCHKEILSAKHAHKPASDDCATCDKPHTSSVSKLLTMEPRALCLSCPADVGKTIDSSKFPHDPTKGECLQCHTEAAGRVLGVTGWGADLPGAPKCRASPEPGVPWGYEAGDRRDFRRAVAGGRPRGSRRFRHARR